MKWRLRYRWLVGYRQFLSLPSWLLVVGMRRWLPADHPWKPKGAMPFSRWWRGATTLTLNHGLIIWFCLINCAVLGIRMNLRK